MSLYLTKNVNSDEETLSSSDESIDTRNSALVYNDESHSSSDESDITQRKAKRKKRIELEKKMKFKYLLAELVEKHPIIYDHRIKTGHKTYKKRCAAWEIIAKKLKTTVDKCKATWAIMRAKMCSHLNTINVQAQIKGSMPNWGLYKPLEYLIPHLRFQYDDQYYTKCDSSDEEYSQAEPLSKKPKIVEMETIVIDDDEPEHTSKIDCDNKMVQIETDICNAKMNEINTQSDKLNNPDNVGNENVCSFYDDSTNENINDIKTENIICANQENEIEHEVNDYQAVKTENDPDIDIEINELQNIIDNNSSEKANQENQIKHEVNDSQAVKTENDPDIDIEINDLQNIIDNNSSEEAAVNSDNDENDQEITVDGDKKITGSDSDDLNDEANRYPDKFTKLDVKLLSLIQKHPYIYKITGRRTVYLEEKNQSWIAIAEEMGLSIAKCKLLWKQMKSLFLRAVKWPLPDKNIPISQKKRAQIQKRKWVLQHMNFFLPYSKARLNCLSKANKIIQLADSITNEPTTPTTADEVVSDQNNVVVTEEQEETTLSEDEAEDCILKSYIENVLNKKEGRQKNRQAIDVEDELSYYTNFFSPNS